MSNGRRRILVIGQSSSILEGLADLLQLVGYHVDMSSGRAGLDQLVRTLAPNLVIVDLSTSSSDVQGISEQISRIPHGSDIPFLFVSFSGDNSIRELQRKSRQSENGHLHYYAHTLLGMDGLLEEVQACLH